MDDEDRDVLYGPIAAGIRTYQRKRRQVPHIVCPRCGSKSYNTNDIAQRYCARCKEFHDNMKGEDNGSKTTDER